MEYKSLTVKIKASEKTGTEFTEYEFPKLTKLLDEGWQIKETFFNTTNINYGYLFITYNLTK